MFFEASKHGSAGRERGRGRTARTCVSLAIVVVLVAAERWATAASPRVLATTTVVADLVRQVAGERVVLDCLMAPGIDPHSYKATPRDADRLARADLVVASGLHLEGKLSDLLGRLARRVPVVAVADAIPADRLLEAGAGLHDPHVWFDAALWSLCVPALVDRLVELDPDGAADYRAGGDEYVARLLRLDDEVRQRLSTVPKGRRVLVTAHDAFGYFGRAYDVEVVGIQGTSTEAEAGLSDINRLVDLVVTRRIPAVFVETSVSDRNVAALREGARARGHAVALGGRLYSDSLGDSGEAATLEGAIRANVEAVVMGLGTPTADPSASPSR